KSLSREPTIVNYRSLPRLLQRKNPSSRRDLDAWVVGKSGFTDPGKYRPYVNSISGHLHTDRAYNFYLARIHFMLTSNRRNVSLLKEKEHMKDYSRNFRYVPEKGKFQMDSDSSEDEHRCERHNFLPDYDIGLSPTPDNPTSTSDIYRSIAGLPRDLEYLLKKADDENLDDGELTRLRNRLEQMESQMTRFLEVLNESVSTLSQKTCHASESDDHARGEDAVEALYSAEEDNI
ncbi:unnamed protein product, partial [Rodentolepis nana]|uniref:HSF_DOMAIN domain-containing protein n=1 Tax=Rodentolepis nana TaxID=102285 RepID=A0A0R3T332_RODNA